MSKKSMTDVAFEMLSKKKRSVAFAKLWEEVCTKMGFDETMAQKKIAQFYTDMMLDNRFASLEDNKWDLRSRRTYEETHFDTSSILIDDDDLLDEEFEFIDDDEVTSKNEEDEY